MEIEDILGYPAERAARGEPEFEETYMRRLRLFSRRFYSYRPLLALLESLSGSRRRAREVDILFLGTSFLHLMLQTRSRHSIASLVEEKHDLRMVRRHAIPPGFAWKWKVDLYRAYTATTDTRRRELLELTVADIERTLRRFSPRVVVLKNDSLFLERAVITAARSLGIPAVTIQHGLFMRVIESSLFDGYWTDHMLVWGEVFRDLYLENDILPEGRVHVLGYPFPVTPIPARSIDDPPTICLLGQPWELYVESLREMKYQVISTLRDACARMEIDLIYRPHPAEQRDALINSFPSLRLTSESATLGEAINSYDYFLSWTSTALIEAALHGRSAAQIRSDAVPMDDFSAIGACFQIEGNEEGIVRYLEGVKRSEYPPMAVNDRYVHITADPGEEFSIIFQNITDPGV
ncbi:hypothetical protein ACFL6T_01580 [Candidatus Zixiibacteriota bacterium]